MTHDIEANKKVAVGFINAFNGRDIAALSALLHPEFVWTTMVVGDHGPNELRPMQSQRLQGLNIPHKQPRLNRAESIAVFTMLLQGQYGDAMKLPGADADEAPLPDDGDFMQMKIISVTAEEDRVAIEAESDVTRPEGARYNQFYHHAFRVKGGQLLHFKEYQDTLHLFDVVLCSEERAGAG